MAFIYYNYFMATLTESSVSARKIIRYSLYAFVLFLFFRFLTLTAVDLYHKYFPQKPEATLAFGKLPSLPFPQREAPTGLSYSLELPQGSLPVFQELVEVYFMPPFQRNINALEDARQKATAFSFQPQEKQVAETIPNVYVFQHLREPTNFTINIVTGIFSIGYNFDGNPQVLTGIPPAAATASINLSTVLTSANVFPADLKNGTNLTRFFKVEGGQFIEVSSLSEASLTRVDIARKGYGKQGNIPPVGPNFPDSNVWFMLAGGSKNPVVGEYHYFPVDQARLATYPIKTSEEAWKELTAGRAFIANPGNADKTKVIRRVYLAYYDAGQYTPFYQPVIAFEGDGGFAAYVPAVVSDYYGGALPGAN